MAIEKIEAVKKVSRALEKPPGVPERELERVPANREHFESLLDATKQSLSSQQLDSTKVKVPEAGIEQIEKNPILAEEKTSSQRSGSATDQEKKRQQQAEEVEVVEKLDKKKTPSSLFQEVGKLNQEVHKAAQLSPEDLKNQAKGLIAQIEDTKSHLTSVQSNIKSSYHNVLRNRLTHIDDSLKIALSKAGVEYTPPVTPQTPSSNPIERFIGMLSNSQYQLEHLSTTIENLGMTKNQLTPASMLAIQIKIGYVQQQIELFTNMLNKALESTKTIMNVQV